MDSAAIIEQAADTIEALEKRASDLNADLGRARTKADFDRRSLIKLASAVAFTVKDAGYAVDPEALTTRLTDNPDLALAVLKEAFDKMTLAETSGMAVDSSTFVQGRQASSKDNATHWLRL